MARALTVVVATSLALLSGVALAHPLGTASINRYEGFEYVGDARFRVAYLVDFAEGPAYAEVEALDADHDGAVTPEEQQRYLASRLPVLLASCAVDVNGHRVAPEVVASHVETVAGEGGKETLRIAAELAVAGEPAGAEVTLRVHDDGFGSVPGWREIHGDDATRSDGGVPAAPSSVAGSPARVTDASFVFHARRGEGSVWLRGWRVGIAVLAVGIAIAGVVTWRRRRRSRASVNATHV